jgi:hypothetical protein
MTGLLRESSGTQPLMGSRFLATREHKEHKETIETDYGVEVQIQNEG